MFKAVTHPKLKKYLMESGTQVQQLNFALLTKLACFVCRETTEQRRLESLFDIFVK
jgi:hypothetical protein